MVSSPKIWGWQAGALGELMVWIQSQSKSEDRRRLISSALRQVERENSLYSTILFHSGLQLIGWGPPTLERAICFTQTTNSKVNLILKHPHRHTQNNGWPNIWALYGLIKLTHKINHHRTQGKWRQHYDSMVSASPFCSLLAPSHWPSVVLTEWSGER